MSPRVLIFAVFALALAHALPPTLAAEQPGAVPEPGTERIANTVQSILPPYWKVSSVEIVTTVNEGDAVEPKLKQRIEVSVSPTVPLYAEAPETAGKLAPFVVIVETTPADAERTLFGIAYGSYRAGEWSVRIGLENGVEKLGRPRDLFDLPSVVAGSDEADDVARQLTQSEKLLDTYAKDRQTRITRFEAEIAAINAKHAVDVSELKARNAAVLSALEENQTKEIDALAEKGEALKAPHEAEIESLVAEHEAAVETLRAKHAAEIEAITNDAQAGRIEAEAKALEALAEREEAKGEKAAELEKARAAASVVLQRVRKAAFDALEAALKSDDLNVRRAAVETALAGDDETLERIALAQSLVSGDWALQQPALVAILATKPVLALETYDRGKLGAVVTIEIETLDPATGNYRGKRMWPGWSTLQGKGSVGQGGLTWRDEQCSVALSLDANGVLDGNGQCNQNTFAAKVTLH